MAVVGVVDCIVGTDQQSVSVLDLGMDERSPTSSLAFAATIFTDFSIYLTFRLIRAFDELEVVAFVVAATGALGFWWATFCASHGPEH